jgi:hypothetical protein
MLHTITVMFSLKNPYLHLTGFKRGSSVSKADAMPLRHIVQIKLLVGELAQIFSSKF